MNARADQFRIKVLYLDDEENNLRSFKAAFRRDYEVHVANNTEKAFQLIKECSPHVIFSDQRMPVTTGVEFFNAVRQVFPDPVRILMTGYTDLQAIVDAINKGHIYRYITKPWNDTEIKVAIENAYDVYLTRRELQQKIAALQKTNDELNRFVYSVSHDLRAPVASIQGLLSVARLEVSDETGRSFLEKIENTVSRLDLLVDNIIDYYKNSKASPSVREINIDELLADVIEAIPFVDVAKEAVVEKEIKQKVAWYGDYFRMRIVLSHLIANAIKFKKPDQPKARIELRFEIEESMAQIEVQDYGVGIIKEHLEQVFKMFFKAKGQHAGAGLGLYVVREALEKMNGDISVDSKPNEGTIFRIRVNNQDWDPDEWGFPF